MASRQEIQSNTNNKSLTKITSNYKSLKSGINLPLKIKMFYSMLQDVGSKNGSPTVSKDLQKKYRTLLSVFKRQSQSQQERFLYESLKIVKSILCKDKQSSKDQSNTSESDGMDLIKDIQTTCKIKESFLGFDKWQKRTFKLNTKSYKLKIGEGKKQFVINLPYYFIRKSQKRSKTFTLQSISQNIQQSKSQLYINFDNNMLFQEVYNHTFNCIVQAFAKWAIKLINQKQQSQYQFDSTKTGDEMSKASTILTTKVLNQYFKIKDKIMRKLQNCSYKFEDIETNSPHTKIGIGKDKNKIRIKIQRVYQMKIQQLQKKLSILSRKPDNRLIEHQTLQIFSKNINAVYFKYLFNGQIYQFLTILEENIRSDEATLIFKGIDNFINQQFVDFMYIRFKDNGNGQTIMRLIGIVRNQQKNKSQAVQFLSALVQPVKVPQTSDHKQQFWTVKEMQNVQMQDCDFVYGCSLQNQVLTKRNEKFETQSKTTNINLLKRSYIIQPTSDKTLIYLKQHPLFTDFVVHKNGGVLCINQEQVNEQKKVFKWVISKIGSNIMQRKNILNISFPITIFSKQTHLRSVAKNFSYAPMFLQQVADKSPLQKMKAAVLLQISTTILVISMNKPFNPILGETYQGYIDGCPIFLEQVSHHPPISSYYLIGRGYKIYGSVAPKIAVGLNCVKGWSPPPNFIQFDDGTIIQFTMNKMVINGMLFGERTFNFEGINYMIDHKNRIAAQICYGIEGSSLFKKKQLSYDSVSGGIYDISSQKQKINTSNFSKYQKQKLSSFIGRWHQQIFMDEKKAINLKTDLPYQLIDHQYPIASDSKYRTDLQLLIKGDQQNAQKQKQFLQQVQRRDKKLRQQFKKLVS